MTALVPDGPLHPGDAVLALAVGLAVALLARRRSRPWTLLVLVAFVAVLSQRHGAAIIRGYADRPAPAVPLAATLFVGGLTARGIALRRPPAMRVVVALLGSLAAVWAMVPDTEAALIAGAVLVGAATGCRRARSRSTGLLAVLPIGCAVIGTVGRPEALGPAVVAAGAVGIAVYVAMTLISRSTRWAGTPTTVVRALTSSRTTDPAPMVAP